MLMHIVHVYVSSEKQINSRLFVGLVLDNTDKSILNFSN